MPSAYTAILGETEDMKLKDFAMLCARSFGACIEMRDLPLSEPIPEKFEPSPFYKDRLDKAKKEYADFIVLSDSEKRAFWERTFEKALEESKRDYEEASKQKDMLRRRYNAMLFKVIKWIPPTPEHIDLQKFMIKQIHDSIERDCKEYMLQLPKKDEWCDIERYTNSLKREVEYYQECYDEEQARYASRNKWLDDLRNSFEDE